MMFQGLGKAAKVGDVKMEVSCLWRNVERIYSLHGFTSVWPWNHCTLCQVCVILVVDLSGSWQGRLLRLEIRRWKLLMF